MAGNRVTVTVEHTVNVNRTPEEVFDYTQDYATRSAWDSSVTAARVVNDEPRRVEMTMRGIGPFVLEYKLFRRGGRTSAAFNGMRSRLSSGGGGSWDYAPRDRGTDWTQTSALEFRHGFVGRLLAPLVRRNMESVTAKVVESMPS